MTLALDPSSEIVCCGAMEPFEIFVWSLQTGKLMDCLTGHAGPVSSLSFGTDRSGPTQLVSG
jgi:periodic tryptophan protein 2